jgi:hypothetical protein
LDTSVIRSVSTANLRRASEVADLYVSPITVYELLCHVDEVANGGSDFELFRRTLLKCRLATVLPDPYAAHATAIGAERLAAQRFGEEQLCAALLNELSLASSLEEFYSRHVTYPTGENAALRDCAARVRATLADEERRYVAHLHDLKKKVLSDPNVGGGRSANASRFCERYF